MAGSWVTRTNVVAQPLGQADPAQHLDRGASGVGSSHQFQRQHDVFQRRQVAQQLEALEHKTDLA